MRASLTASALALSLGSLAGVGSCPQALAADMEPYASTNARLLEAEYLPFIGLAPLRYPDEVLFGFYAEGSSDVARTCALRAFRQLKNLLIENPDELRRFASRGGATDFYLWIDDYTLADPNRDRRSPRLWHWSPDGDRDYTRGLWKWEAVLTQAGNCLLPHRTEALEMLSAAADTL